MSIFDPLSPLPPVGRPWGVNFGGGTNSTALVIECVNRGLRPDWILFADTGSERPETYEGLSRLADWLRVRDWTPLSTTRWEREKPLENGATFESLEDNCLRTSYMPSKAYGYAGCSTKYKRQPCQKWRTAQGFEGSVYAIGYDAGERKRVAKALCMEMAAVGEHPWYPLYVWGITRKDCDAIVAAAGLPSVPKSACFFCPNNKQHEWLTLREEHPELYARAMEIEARAVAAGNATEAGLRRSDGYLRDLEYEVTHQVALFRAPPRDGDSELLDSVMCDCFESDADDVGAA